MAEQKSMTTKPTFDEAAILSDYKKAHKGKLSDAQIEEGVKSLSGAMNAAQQAAAQAKYGAKATIVTTFGWVRVTVEVNGGKSCEGNGGGVFGLGGGVFGGDVYTDDLQRLYKDSVSFQVNLVGMVYLNINFFDGNSNLLGSFQGGGFSPWTSGVGGGKLTTTWR
jgi:hypothetical protein